MSNRIALVGGTPQSKVFVREATGLIKSVGPLTIFFSNMGEVGFGTNLLFLNAANSYLPNGNPGGNVVFAVLLFTLFVAFECFIYYRVVQDVGRTAGDYVWISRTMGPIIGGLLILGFTFTGIPFIAITLNWLVTLSLSPSIATIGAVTANHGVVSFATNLESPTNIIILSVVILAIITAVDVLSPKNGFRLLAAFVGVALIGTFMMAAVLLAYTPTDLRSYVDSFLSAYGSSYNSISSQYHGAYASLPALILLLPFISFSLPWVNNAAAFSGEIKNLKRSAWMGTFMPALTSGLLLAGFMAAYYRGLGFDFSMAAPNSWPNALNTIGATPNVLTIATIAMGKNPAYVWVMNIAFSFWYLAAVQQTILSISRYVFGLSFDRVLPTRLAHVSDRFHSPVVSLLVAALGSVPFIAVVAYTNFASVFSTTALGMIFFAFIGINGVVYALKGRAHPKKTTIVAGVITAIFFFGLTFMFLFMPYYGSYLPNGSPNWLSLGLIIFFLVMGALLYPLSKAYHAKRGIDVSLIFKELPPE
ncbi:MAG: APC family permease [Thermoprotei archaeon]